MQPKWLNLNEALTSRLIGLADSLEKGLGNTSSSGLSLEGSTEFLDRLQLIQQDIAEIRGNTERQLCALSHREKIAGRHELTWLRTRVDDILRETSEDISKITKRHDGFIRDTLLPHGKFHELARGLSGRLEIEDFEIEDYEESSVIQLRESTAIEIQRRVIKELIVYLEEEAQRVNCETNEVIQRVGKEVGCLTGWNIKFREPEFEIARVQDFAATSALAPISTHSEIQRISKGVFAWRAFVHPAMLAGMLLMPFWILTMDLRSKDIIDKSVNRSGLLLVIFSILYPGYLFFQLQKVPRDRKNQIAKELKKARQTVKSEVEKSFRAVLDEHKRSVTDHWRKVIDDLRRQVTECVGLAGEVKQEVCFFEERLSLLKRVESELGEIKISLNPGQIGTAKGS
ncbi:MAG: hypothetical protein KDN18_20110 [Verrucomicrobiae bacterium]|nr:hypothetical protein [Verrucomicrobiae bacterium]